MVSFTLALNIITMAIFWTAPVSNLNMRMGLVMQGMILWTVLLVGSFFNYGFAMTIVVVSCIIYVCVFAMWLLLYIYLETMTTLNAKEVSTVLTAWSCLLLCCGTVVETLNYLH